MTTPRARSRPSSQWMLLGLAAVACLGNACGGGGTPSTSGATLDGAWTSTSFLGHPTALFLRERAGGRALGYLPADPSVLLTGGGRIGDLVVLAFTQEDPGAAASGSFSGTLSADGTALAGSYDDGSGPVPVTFTRSMSALTVEHWLLVDFAQDEILRASRLRDAADVFSAGGFVGVRGCGFLACAGDWTAWSVSGDDHTIDTTSGGRCPSSSTLVGTWSAPDLFLSGTYTTTNCNGSSEGGWGGGRVGFTTTAHVMAALDTIADMLDAFEAESTSVVDALASAYLHDGRTKADVLAEVTSIFADYDNLEAGATLREVISENSGEEFPDVAAPPRLEWHLEVTGIPALGGPREVVVDVDTAEFDQEDLRWIAMDAGTVRFVGNGYATPFEIEMPILPADTAHVAFGLWPWGVHGGGHPEGHPGWDVEFACGAQVRAVADGTITAIEPNGSFAGQWNVTIAHRPGRSTRFDHLANLQAGIVVGASVVTGQLIADAGMTGLHCMTHFAVQTGIDTRCPEPFLSSTGRAVFDTIWAGASYSEEFCEPLPCNPTDLSFPLTRGWTREAGALSPRIDFIRLDPTTQDYRYTLRDAVGTALEAGVVMYDTLGSTIDLVPDGGGATHLGRYDIVGDTLWIDWSDLVRPASLAGASQYRFDP